MHYWLLTIITGEDSSLLPDKVSWDIPMVELMEKSSSSRVEGCINMIKLISEHSVVAITRSARATRTSVN